MKRGLTDADTTLAELKERVLAFARERDWEQFHAPKNLSMALAAEAGELMEHFLWATSADSHDVARDKKKRREIDPADTAHRPCSHLNRPCHLRSTWPSHSKETARPLDGRV